MSIGETTQKCPNCGEVIPLEYSVCPFCGFGILEYELKKFSYKPRIKEVINRAISFYKHPIKTSDELGIATETKGANIIIYLFSLFMSLRLFFTIMKAHFIFYAINIGSIGDPPHPFMTIRLSFILFLISVLVMPFFIWLMYKILFIIGAWFISKFSAIFGSDVKVKQLKTILGYSIGPVALGEFLGIFFTLIGPRGDLGQTSSVTFDQILQFMQSFYASGVIIAFKFLMIIMWTVTFFYATVSIRNVGKMAWLNAIIAMGLPLGFYVWFIYILGMFG